jgi:hypothetical protein
MLTTITKLETSVLALEEHFGISSAFIQKGSAHTAEIVLVCERTGSTDLD